MLLKVSEIRESGINLLLEIDPLNGETVKRRQVPVSQNPRVRKQRVPSQKASTHESETVAGGVRNQQETDSENRPLETGAQVRYSMHDPTAAGVAKQERPSQKT